MRTLLDGVTVPLVTPFADEGIDWEAFDSLLEHVLAGGVDAVFPCGTTGEVASLTRSERRAVIERTNELTPADVPVLAGGTGTAVTPSIEWLEVLADCGVDAAVVTAPYFHPWNDPSGLEHFFDRLLDATPPPIVLYNIPACVGRSLPVPLVARLAERAAVIGVKDSSGDLDYGLRLQAAVPDDVPLLQGWDALLVPACRSGFAGGINALANVYPRGYAAIVADPTAEEAWTLQRDVIGPLFEHCRTDGFAPVAKAGLAARDVLPGTRVRPPLAAVGATDVAAAVDRGLATLANE